MNGMRRGKNVGEGFRECPVCSVLTESQVAATSFAALPAPTQIDNYIIFKLTDVKT